MAMKDFTAQYLTKVMIGERNPLHFSPSEAQEELVQRGILK